MVERFNRSIRDLIDKYMTEYNTNKYIDVLDKLVSNYNNRKHTVIKMSPNFAHENNYRDFDRL
jgi:hypothetical protein